MESTGWQVAISVGSLVGLVWSTLGCAPRTRASVSQPMVVVERLDCSARPMQVISGRSVERDTLLAQRGLGRFHVSASLMDSNQPVVGVQVEVLADTGRAAPFTDASLTDSTGVAELEAQAGTYHVRLLMIGLRGGQYRAALRSGFADTLRVLLDVQAICDGVELVP